MSVGICTEVTYADPRLLAAVLGALVDHNAELYQRGVVTTPPWSLRWVPDQMRTCTVEGVCKMSDASVLQDVAILEKRGFGSCGPLAAAYAAWQRVHGGRAYVELMPDVEDGAWHVVAWSDGVKLDPQTIGAR